MLFSFLLLVGLIVAIIAAIAVPLFLRPGVSISSHTLFRVRAALLWFAGILSGLMMLISLAAAAWGMNTRLPWGLGVYMYLIPALSLPAFLLLKFPGRTLSPALWLLTVLNAPVWFFGDRADRLASGLKPLSGPSEITGMFLNAFTLLYIIISVLVQLAELCGRKSQTELAPTQGVE
jgi:hypothetical protein